MDTSTGGNHVFSLTNGTPPVARTVGFRVFTVTNGMKLGCPHRFLPWVFAFLPLPTVQNRCQARLPYRWFLRFDCYPRYAAGRAYRGFSRFRCYQRYEIGLSMPIPTVGFRVFTVTNGMKLGCPCRFLPWVFAFSPSPTVENRCQAR